jgi:protein phosphatase
MPAEEEEVIQITESLSPDRKSRTNRMGNTLKWRGVGLTDIGRVRPTNQDAFAALNPLSLWVVADGMGGHAGGAVASRIAVETTREYIQANSDSLRRDRTDHSRMLLQRAIAVSNNAILQEALTDPMLSGMGTTILILHITAGRDAVATVAHVGDSRAYLLRGTTCTPLTRDHSAVEEYVRQGWITPDQALTHPHRHLLSRALGTEAHVEPDIATHPLEPDDLLLLCTDGLTKMLDDRQIADTILGASSSPDAICRGLVEEANSRGGLDNTTVVIVRLDRTG